MKRYALRYVSGPFKGLWQGSMGSWHKSPSTPKLYTKRGMAEKYRKVDQEIVTFVLVEQDQLPIKVDIWEHERGWGAKIDSTRGFLTVKEADQYCYDYNKRHNPPVERVPDWYMVALRR